MSRLRNKNVQHIAIVQIVTEELIIGLQVLVSKLGQNQRQQKKLKNFGQLPVWYVKIGNQLLLQLSRNKVCNVFVQQLWKGKK